MFRHVLCIAAALGCANALFAPFCQSQEIVDDFKFTADGTQPVNPPVLSIALLPSGNDSEIVELRLDDADHGGIAIESSEDLDSWAIIGEIPAQENSFRLNVNAASQFFRASHN